MLPLIVTIAIVVEDQTVLRAAPEEEAPRAAVTAKGDWLEVRGKARQFLSVYDHRRERAGYVAPERVRTFAVDEASAARIGPVIDFLRDARGEESLGIGLVALFLRVASNDAVGPEVFDALGTFAERLARRASEPGASAQLAAHLEVAEAYGLHFRRLEGGATCYDGEAFRRVLALGGAPQARARAASALSDPRCAPKDAAVAEARAWHRWAAEVLDQVDVGRLEVLARNRIHLARAQRWARVTHDAARGGDGPGAARAFERALDALARVDRTELFGADRGAYEEAAIAVAAERWARDVAPRLAGGAEVGGGERPGETCLRLPSPSGAPERAHCTFAHVWPGSLEEAPGGGRWVVAVEPIPGWVELRILTRSAEGWRVDALVPAATEPHLGYVELAGFGPEGSLLVVREAKIGDAVKREFQVIRADTLEVLASGRRAKNVRGFEARATAAWRAGTLASR